MSLRAALTALVLAGAPAAQAATPPRGRPRTSVVHRDGKWRGRFTYSLVSGQLFEWNTDPTAVPGLFREVEKRAGIECVLEVGTMALDSRRLSLNPLIIMTGNRVFRLTDSEIRSLRAYLLGGGFIYADDCGGSDYSFRRMLRQVAPDAKLEELPAKHPIFSVFYKMEKVPKIVDLYHGPARAYGLTLNGRLAVVYTYDTDIPCAWETYPDGSYVHAIPRGKREAAFRLGVNALLFALSQHAVRGEAPEIARDAAAPATEFPGGALRTYRTKRVLPCDHIRAIAGDEDAVWFGGWTYLPGEDEGIARYDRKTGQFRLFMDAEGVLAEEINTLVVREGSVLIGADTWKFSKGLSVFEPGQRRWRSYTKQDGLPHDRVIDIQARGKDVWLACRSGLAVWDTETDAFRHVDVPGGAWRSFIVSVLATRDAVWVNNFEHVWRHVPERNAWTKVEDLTPLLRGVAASLAQDEGHVYIAPREPKGSPLVVYEKRTGSFEPFQPAIDSRIEVATAVAAHQPLPSETAPGRPARREIWIGTGKGEVIGFPEDSNGRFPLANVIRKRTGKGQVGRIYAEGPDVFAAVHPFGGVWHYGRRRRTWQQFKTRRHVPSDHILSLAVLNGALLLGTLSDGPWSFTPREERPSGGSFAGGWRNLNYELLCEGQRVVYLGDRSAIRYTTIHDILADESGAWMATNHGLVRHDPRSTPRGFEILAKPMGPIARLASGKGTIYCGLPDGGVRVFDTARKRWRPYEWKGDEPTKALAASGSTLWVATDAHLVTLVDTGRSLEERGRTGARVSSLLVDGKNLWIAGSPGIYRHAGQGPLRLETPVAAVKGAVALARYKEFLLAANGHGLWKLQCSSSPGPLAITRYNTLPHTRGHPITSMALANGRLYVGTHGGGLLAIVLTALRF